MGSGDGPKRYWREHPEFVAAREQVARDARRFDDFFRGFEFALLTDPEQVSWEVAKTDGVRVMSTELAWEFPEIPELWVYFKITDNGSCIDLLYIHEVPKSTSTLDEE